MKKYTPTEMFKTECLNHKKIILHQQSKEHWFRNCSRLRPLAIAKPAKLNVAQYWDFLQICQNCPKVI